MKKALICTLLAACVCLSLCGCGGMSAGRDNAAVETPMPPLSSPDVIPEALPTETPSVEDGIVRDDDGLIGEDGTEAETETGTNSAPASPSPQPGDRP